MNTRRLVVAGLPASPALCRAGTQHRQRVADGAGRRAAHDLDAVRSEHLGRRARRSPASSCSGKPSSKASGGMKPAVQGVTVNGVTLFTPLSIVTGSRTT